MRESGSKPCEVVYLDWVEMPREGRMAPGEAGPYPESGLRFTAERRAVEGGGGAAAQPHNPANDTTMLETPSPISPLPGFISQKIFKVQIYSPQTTKGVSHIHLVLAIKYRISLEV